MDSATRGPRSRPKSADSGGSARADRDLERPRATLWPFHPVLAAAFPVLALYTNNMGQVSAAQLVRPLAMAILATLAVWLVFGLATGSAPKGALIASAAILAFFTYGHVMNLASDGIRWLVAPIGVLAMAGVLVAIWQTRGPLRNPTYILNLASIALVAPSCWGIGLGLLSGQRAGAAPVNRALASKPVHVIAPPASPHLPDIYYVILDAYLRDDRMKLFYSYDNSPFLDALEQRGFYIARKSRSNYDQTGLSLASSLNMTYLDGLAAQVGADCEDFEPQRRMLDDNAVADYLRTKGYHYVFIGSGAGQTRNETADLQLHAGAPVSSFETNLLGLTAMQAAPAAHDSLYEGHRKYVRAAFSYLDSVARLPYQKFVFVHICAPHPPFVFGPNGEARDPRSPQVGEDGSWLLKRITAQQYRDGYISQVQFINKQTLKAVDAILKQSKNPPIIILQGDHGSRLRLDWESLARTDLREPFSILNAYHVPKAVRSHLYQTITPVNTFRVLLSQMFGAREPVLPDRTYYSTAAQPYNFTEVTRLIPRT